MRNLAAQMPFAAHLDISVTEASADEVQGVMVVKPEYCTVGNVAHGGAVVTLADSLGAVGGYLNLPKGSNGTATIDSKINFLRSAECATTLRGVAKPVSVGKRVSIWQTKVVDDRGQLIALVIQTQLVL